MAIDKIRKNIIKSSPLLIMLLSVVITLGCDKITEMKADDTNYSFMGNWYLDRVVLKSEMYNEDITKNGYIIPVDVEDYLGYTIVYAPDYFQIGDKIYYNPIYNLSEMIAKDFNEGGGFRRTYPDFFELIENESIKIDDVDRYEYIEDVPLTYLQIMLSGDDFIQIGTQCIILNDETMLIGVWGKVIIAYKMVNND